MVKIAILIILVFALSACVEPAVKRSSTPAPTQNPVVQRIRLLSDCQDLQAEFDIAMTNWERGVGASRSYALAARDRMRVLDC